jgi:hypothetical protein
MKRLFLALVCAAIGFSDSAVAEPKQMYVHWTLRPIGPGNNEKSKLKLDKPYVVDDNPGGSAVCAARGYLPPYCRHANAIAAPNHCTCVVIYSKPREPGSGWTTYPGPSAACRDWIERVWQTILPGAKVEEIDEYCPDRPTS